MSEAVNAFLLSREAQGLSPKTLDIYRERLCPFVSFADDATVGRVRPEDVDAYMVFLQRRRTKYVNNRHRPTEKGGLAPATIEGIKEALRVFFNWCVDRHIISHSPAAHLRRKKFSRYAGKRSMEPEHLMQMLAYASLAARAQNPIDIRDLALLAFTADSLARVGEVSALDVDSINFNKSFGADAVFEAHVDGKVGERFVSFSEQTALYMLDWLDVRPDVPSRSFFVAICRHHFRVQHPRCTACRVFGNRLTTNAIAQAFKRIAKRAGVEGKCNPHAIRHLGGIVYAERAGIEVAQEKLGHTTIVTTRMHYIPHNRDRVRRETAKLSPVANRPDK
jgi:integrase